MRVTAPVVDPGDSARQQSRAPGAEAVGQLERLREEIGLARAVAPGEAQLLLPSDSTELIREDRGR